MNTMTAIKTTPLTATSATKKTVGSNNPLASRLYQLHGFQILDAFGKQVGLVDWIWSDQASGLGEFIGVQLQLLRGKARAIPTRAAQVDMKTKTVRVTYRRDEIKRAPRFSIDRVLTDAQKQSIQSFYSLRPAIAPSLRVSRNPAV
jgi:hypothetical protein